MNGSLFIRYYYTHMQGVFFETFRNILVVTQLFIKWFLWFTDGVNVKPKMVELTLIDVA